jgi:sigma-B regulation protein RsbU (phosphoserine phosphatase)
MQDIPKIGGLRFKIIFLLLVSVLPIVLAGFITLMEMNQATERVQSRMVNLSTGALNRSALVYATSGDTDQLQLAVAKASQYDAIFKRVQYQAELISNLAARPHQDNQTCTLLFGSRIATSSNESITSRQSYLPGSLCTAYQVLQSIVDQESLVDLGYIITSDGVLVSWPDVSKDLEGSKPFDPRILQSYTIVERDGKADWTKPYLDLKGSMAITYASPIKRDGNFSGVVGLDIPLWALSGDLSGMLGRGYPFIADDEGKIIIGPRMDPQNAPWPELLTGVPQEDNPQLRAVLKNMSRGETGSAVVRMSRGDCFITYAPVTSAGWSLGMAFPAETMQLPASYIKEGVTQLADETTRELGDANRNIIILMTAALLITALVIGISGVFLTRKVIRPLKDLTSAAEKMSKGDLESPMETTYQDELGDLSQALSGIQETLLDKLGKAEKEGGPLGHQPKEAGLAEEIRRKLSTVRIPQRDDYEIAAFSLRGQGEGLDFYEILELEETCIALQMGYVAGGGDQAFLSALISKAATQTLARAYRDPALALQEANIEICRSAGMPVTCFLGTLDTQSHTLEYVNAGHTPPFVVSSQGGVDTLSGSGIALGSLDNIDPIPERWELQQNEILAIYSDGLTEALNGAKRPFGTERLITAVRDSKSRMAQEIVETVEKDFRKHTSHQSLKSDATLIIIKRL